MIETTARQLFAVAIAGALLAGAAAAQPLGSAIAPTLNNPNRYAVTGAGAAGRFFRLAATRRVDMCIVGDSNTRANICGHETGMGVAFGGRFGTYATAVEPGVGVGWWSASIASTSSTMFPPFDSEGAPLHVQLRTFEDGGFPASYAHLPYDTTVPSSYNSGLTIMADSLIDIAGPLRYHATQWIYGPSSPGYTNPTCRPAFPGNPFLNYVASPTVTSAGASQALGDFTMDVPAGPRTPDGLLFCLANVADDRDAQGPVCVTWQRVENTQHPRGISYSPLWGFGGLSAYHACFAMQSALSPMIEWMRQATQLQNDVPVLMVQILHGGNDINSHMASVGPIGGLESSTPEGQEDNTRGIILSVRNAWVVSGRDPANLFFLLGPYHPVPYTDSPQTGYEQGWRNIVAGDPQVTMIAGTMLTTADELSESGLLSGGTDISHLAVPGFMAWGRTTISALSRAICPGDFDENGTLSTNDIFAYLEAWFARDMRADFNYSRTLEVQDIFDFLGAWFGGC